MCVCVSQGMDDALVRSAATDIFSYLVEYNPSMVREFVMQECQQNDDVSDRTHTRKQPANVQTHTDADTHIHTHTHTLYSKHTLL